MAPVLETDLVTNPACQPTQADLPPSHIERKRICDMMLETYVNVIRLRKLRKLS